MHQTGANPENGNVIRSRQKSIGVCAVDKGEIICSNIVVSIPIYKCLMKEQCNNPSDVLHEIERRKCKAMSGRTLTVKCSSSLGGTGHLIHDS